MLTLHLLFVGCTVITTQLVKTQSDCDDAYSCVFADISSSQQIGCYGYHSCNQASLQTSSNINCYGGFSCLDANIVYSSDRNIYCHGLGSCARIDFLGNFNERIDCYGELSCYRSNIFSSNLYCTGERSCADSIVYISSSMLANGYASAKNCTFYSTNSSSNYYFGGPYSGDNATIICGNGHTCLVYCYINGCNNVKLLCNGTCNLIVSCSDDAVQSDVCPNGTTINQDNKLAKLNLLSFEDIYENSVTGPCYTAITNAIHCDDYQECEDSPSLDTTNINAPICCTSYFGCYNVDNITSMILLNSNVINDISIRCDGSLSCQYSNHIEAVNGGNIHITGYRAGHSVDIIETTHNSDIFCTARQSCGGSTLKNANNTYCSGYWACGWVTITNVSNIWMYGSFAGWYSSFTGLKNRLHCGGTYSCMATIISRDVAVIKVIGVGFGALYSTNITAVEMVCSMFSNTCINIALLIDIFVFDNSI